MKTLNLVLKHEWFDLINSGQKTKEFREVKPYWNRRLKNKKYDSVRFQRGYKRNPETMFFKVKKIYISSQKNDLNLKKVWVIDLGQRFKPLTGMKRSIK